MAKIGIGFQLSASAAGMASGINAGVVELKKLGYQAKRTADDVRTLKTIEVTRLFLSSVSALSAGITRAQQVLSGFVNESVSIGEEASKATVLFGDAAKSVATFADSSTAIGLSRREALKATGVYGNLFRSIGMSEQASASFSIELTKLGVDLASFNNTTVDEALTALGAALRGESEPIRRYGVVLDEATLKAKAFALGLVSSVKDGLTPSVKVQAAYAAILERTQNAQGDALKTAASLANQQKQLSAAFANVSASIGEGLQPVYLAFISGLKESLPEIEATGKQIASFIGRVDFGSAVRASVAAVSTLAKTFLSLIPILEPLARNLLPTIGGALAFINRQAITAGIASLGKVFLAARAAALAYAGSAATAAAANAALAASIRTVLASTGIGVLVVLLGVAAGALLEYAMAGKSAAADVDVAIEQNKKDFEQLQKGIENAQAATVDFGKAAAVAFKIPERVTQTTLVDNLLGDAANEFKKFANELGNLAKVPKEIAALFQEVRVAAELTNEGFYSQAEGLTKVRDLSAELLSLVKQETRAREETAKAIEESQKLAQSLIEKSSPVQTASIQAEKELLALEQERSRVVQRLRQLQISSGGLDANAQAAAQDEMQSLMERLRAISRAGITVKKTFADVQKETRFEQLGLSKDLFVVPDELPKRFKAVATAFGEGLINELERANALDALGFKEARAIFADIRKTPAAQPLIANDIRTQEGFAQVVALATGREDPAIAQRRAQLDKLEEIRRAVEKAGLNPAEILGT